MKVNRGGRVLYKHDVIHVEKMVPYHQQPYTYKYDPVLVAEPWRENYPNAFELPLRFLSCILDPDRTSVLRANDSEYLNKLEARLLAEGIHTPLELHVDADEKIRIQEGHHRMIVCLRLPEVFPRVPVEIFRGTQRMRGYGRTLSAITDEILTIMSDTTIRR